MTDGPSAGSRSTVASRRLMVAIVFVVAVVVLALVLSFMRFISGGQFALSGGGSVCGLEAVEMSGTVAEPPTATWVLVGDAAAPFVEGQGPGKIDNDGYRSCYARTPVGALLAATNYSAIGSYAPLRKKFYEQATVPGPGRDALLEKPLENSGDGGENHVKVKIAGFRVLRYDGNHADVDIAVRATSWLMTIEGAMVMHLEWSGGDWKLRLADDGSDMSPFNKISSLEGYTLWSGE